MLITGSQFGRLSGTSRQNIYKLVRNSKLSKTEDDKYDTDNQINKNYLLSRGLNQDQIDEFVFSLSVDKNKKQVKLSDMSSQIPDNQPEQQLKSQPIIHKSKPLKIDYSDIDDESIEKMAGLPSKMMKLTIRELIVKYGGPLSLDKWSMILGRLMSADEKDQKVQERRLQLVEKDFVSQKLFTYIDNLSKLLFDFPESCIDKITAVVKSNSGNVRNELVNDMRKELGILIKQVKDGIDKEFDAMIDKHLREKEENE